MAPFWHQLGHLGSILALSWAILAPTRPSWPDLASPCWLHLGSNLAILARPCLSMFVLSWLQLGHLGNLGAPLGHVKLLLGSCWRVLDHLGAMLAPSWLQRGHLGRILALSRAMLSSLWAHVGHLETMLAPPRFHLGHLDATMGPCWLQLGQNRCLPMGQ